MQNLLDLLRSNPYGWGNIPGMQKGPEAYPVADEWGQPHHGVTGNPLYGPDPTLMENLRSLGELPARTVSPYNFDTGEMQVPPMLSEPANALSRVSSSGGLPDPQDPQNKHDISTLLMTMFGGNALAPARAGEAGAMRALSDTGKPSLLGSALAGAESKPIRAYHGSRSPNEIIKFDADKSMNLGPHFGPLETAELFAGTHPWQWQPGHEDLAGHSPGAFAAEAISNEKPGLLSRLGFGNDRVQKTQDRQRQIQTHDADTLSEMANSPDGGRILPVDLDFQNALHVPDLVDKANGLWLPSDIAKALQEHGVSFRPDDWEVFKAGDNARPVAPTGDSGSVMSRNKFGANTAENAAANALIRKRLGDAGYDGIKYADGDTGAGHSYIATSPGTVRSATTGETLFSDTGKPSILGSALAGAEARGSAADSELVRMYHGTNAEDAAKIYQEGFSGPVFLSDRSSQAKQYGDHAMPLDVRKNALKLDFDMPGYYLHDLEGANAHMSSENMSIDDFLNAKMHSFGVDEPNSIFDPNTGKKLFSDTGKPSPLGAALAGAEEQKGITAYHGSPHDFDKFDLSKIGTGEGSQTYGHGLYFADNEAVAQSYSDTLAPLHNQRPFTVNVPGNPFDGIEMLEPDLTAKGHMYQVRLNADPEHFLDWDKPLSGQNEAIQKVISEHDAKAKAAFTGHEIPGWGAGKPSLLGADDPAGSLLYSRAHGLNDRDAYTASEHGTQGANMLREAGIPGIRYLDGGSRKTGEGSHNYVIFNHEIIEILKKYGIAGPMLGQGVGQLIGGRDDQQK